MTSTRGPENRDSERACQRLDAQAVIRSPEATLCLVPHSYLGRPVLLRLRQNGGSHGLERHGFTDKARLKLTRSKR